MAKGEFVHVLHQDDRVGDCFYDAILPKLSDSKAFVAGFSNSHLVDENGDARWGLPLERATAGALENWLPKIIQKQRVRFPSMIVRRAAYVTCGGFSSGLSFAFDWEMWARLAAQGQIWYDPRPLAIYRVHDGSVTNSITATERLTDCFRAVAMMVRLVPKKMRRPVARQAFFLLLGNGWQEAGAMGPDASEYRALVAFLLQGWTQKGETAQILEAMEGGRHQPDLSNSDQQD